MPRGRPISDNPKKEFVQIRVTKEEKEMLNRVKEAYEFESISEMILFFISAVEPQGRGAWHIH